MTKVPEASKIHKAGIVLAWGGRLVGTRNIREVESDTGIIVVEGTANRRAGLREFG